MNFLKHNFSSLPVFLFLSISLFFSGCSTDDDISIPAGQFSNGIFIVNEGNYNEADGSLSFYDKELKSTKLKVFEDVNSRELSGTFQSLTFHNGNGYLISNTGNVEVFTEDSLHAVTTMEGSFSIPRFMAAVENKAYISNWGPYDANYKNPESFIAVLDLEGLETVKTIEIASRPEQLLAHKGNIYVANSAGNVISIIDVETDLVREVEMPEGPTAMELDDEGNIWVVCSSGVAVKFNPETEAIEAIIELHGDGPSGKIAMNGAKNTLYYLTSRYEPDYSTSNNVYSIDLNTLTANPEPIITKKNLYGLGVDPETDIIYVADNNALQGNGTVIMFDADGNEIDNFAVGRNPNGFVFK